MSVKKYLKWLMFVIGTILIYLLSIYMSDALYAINFIVFMIGIYLLYNPSVFVKISPEEFSRYKSELDDKLKDYNGNSEFRKKELLADYKSQFIFSLFIGIINLIAICISIYVVNVSQHKWYEYVFIFFLFVLVNIHESRDFKYLPSSRYNRARLKYFIHELQHNVNAIESVNKSTMIVNNIKVNHSEIKNDYSNTVYDSRVLQNNFITTIDTGKKEIRQLDTESNFWKFFMKLSDDVNVKVDTLFQIVDNLNFNYFIKNKKYLITYDKKLKKIVFSKNPAVMLGHFIKFLVDLEILNKSIVQDKNEHCLGDLFECSDQEPYYYFKPGEWVKLGKKKNHFKMYYKENDR